MVPPFPPLPPPPSLSPPFPSPSLLFAPERRGGGWGDLIIFRPEATGGVHLEPRQAGSERGRLRALADAVLRRDLRVPGGGVTGGAAVLAMVVQSDAGGRGAARQ